MKKTILNISKYNLLILNLINFKAYLFKKSRNFNFSLLKGYREKKWILDLEQIEVSLKKALNLIHQYTSLNKNILFVGFPAYFSKRFLAKKNFYFFDSNYYSEYWKSGLISNKNNIVAHLRLDSIKLKDKNKGYNIAKPYKSLFKLKKAPDLIVFYSKDKEDAPIIKELILLNKPFVLFSNLHSTAFDPLNINKAILENKICYYVPGNFSKKESEKLLCFLISNLV